MPELLLRCELRCSHSRLFWSLRCCLLLLQLCLLFNHLRSSAFSPFSTGFCHFCIFHTLLSPMFHTSLSPFLFYNLMRFLILSFNSLTWWSLWAKRREFYCLLFYRLFAFSIIIRQYFSSFINARTSSLLRTSVQPFSSFLRASELNPAAATFHSVQPPTFIRFLTFLYWVCHFCIFHTSLSSIFHTSLSPFLFYNLMRFLILSFNSLTSWSLWAKRR